MAKKQAAQAAAPAPRQKRNPPEKKFAVGGIGIAIWLNTVETDDGPKSFRTVTIAPRRYQDKKTGEWKDSNSFHPNDLPALIFCLEKTLEFTFMTPMPEHDPDDTEGDNANGQTGDVPF